MLEINLYGKQTSSYEHIKMNLVQSADKAQIDLNINEINSTDQIIANKIKSIPAIEIAGEIMQCGQQNIGDYVNDLNKKILQIENYGNMKKVIVPIDFSSTATNAVNYALGLSRYLENAVIQLVHVYHPAPPTANGITYIDPKVEEIRRGQFKEYVEEVNLKYAVARGASNTMIDGKFLIGFAASEIVKLAQESSNAIIVMGSNGQSGALKKLFGSVSTTVAMDGKVPVLIVPPNVIFKKLNKVAYAINKNVLDDGIAIQLKSIMTPFDAALELIHVRNVDQGDTITNVSIPKVLEDDSVYYHEFSHDNVQNGVYKYCEQNDVDLISLSPDKRGFLSALFHQSITKAFTLNSNKPLLIIPLKD